MVAQGTRCGGWAGNPPKKSAQRGIVRSSSLGETDSVVKHPEGSHFKRGVSILLAEAFEPVAAIWKVTARWQGLDS